MFDATHISVLHYLVAHMEANLPGALDLEDEEAAIKGAAKRGSLDTSGLRAGLVGEGGLGSWAGRGVGDGSTPPAVLKTQGASRGALQALVV
jgi:hypothetical protein